VAFVLFAIFSEYQAKGNADQAGDDASPESTPEVGYLEPDAEFRPDHAGQIEKQGVDEQREQTQGEED